LNRRRQTLNIQSTILNLFWKEQTMKNILLVTLLAISLAVAGCSGMSDTTKRTGGGAAIGAAAGGVVGAIAGNTPMGLAVGAAAGATGGYLYDRHEKSKEKAYTEGYEAGKKGK
jgi:uncharacterized protein YqgC (DUF456 family)